MYTIWRFCIHVINFMYRKSRFHIHISSIIYSIIINHIFIYLFIIFLNEITKK